MKFNEKQNKAITKYLELLLAAGAEVKKKKKKIFSIFNKNLQRTKSTIGRISSWQLLNVWKVTCNITLMVLYLLSTFKLLFIRPLFVFAE